MPPNFNSNVSYAKYTLPYPVYAAEFDPYNRGYLIVGGGGGEGRSGIPNQISVLDVNNRATIEPAVDIDLSREEDSVSSLASLATKDGLITFAGINSSQAQQDAGKNEHFRSFSIRYPPRKRQKTDDSNDSEDTGEIRPLGKRALLKPSKAPKKETYQRLLRLSPVQKLDQPGKRIGAIASGLAQENEVIVFNATVALPDEKDILTRISLPEKQEAADLDIALTPQGEFSVAYCDEHNIYEQTFRYDFDRKKAEKRPNGPRRAHQMPVPEGFQDPRSRPKFRCLRFLNSENVVALINKPNKKGAQLRVYHLYPTGPALEMSEMNLPSHIKQATSIDVCALDADKNGNQQFVLAVAGQDISIEVYTINYQAATDTFSSFKSYINMRDVHKQQMTKIVFAPFHSPPRAPNPGEQAAIGKNGEPLPKPALMHPGPQYVRLASVSYGNTVVIDTFPLIPLEPKDKDSRYVLSHPGDEAFWRWAYIIVISFCVLVTAFLFQSFMGGFSSSVGPFKYLPDNVREFLDMPAGAAYNRGGYAKVSEDIAAPISTAGSLRSAIDEHHGSPEDAQATAVVVRDVPEGDGIDVHVHPDKEKYLENDVHAKHWHELEEHQKSYFKEKLIKAGQWSEAEGETVLKGVLWSLFRQAVHGEL
ncbi:hypothetical protein PRZ48_007057 [Zasmidium cellare]|uniref:Guanine nucleotide-exchange factor SEC12 n=1 Tax=Zasmidium cellare TaxID=395010 RepID=A0ABR0EJ42_ZASCE|nr:hypothetical protein PRZ48_007057 [Zasmidium cellare]